MLIAAAQMASGPDRVRNLDVATRLVRRAAERGAAFIGLPENVAWMGPEKDRPSAAERLDGPTLSHFAELARERSVHLLAGSVLEAGAPGGRMFNTSVLFGPNGERLAVYRKIHLFDAEVGDGAFVPRVGRGGTRRPAGHRRDAAGQGRTERLLRPALPRAVPGAVRRRAR